MDVLSKYLLGFYKAKASSDHGHRATNNGKNEGFTLLELIVVISLLSIMLVFTIPRFHDSLFLDKTQTSSRWMIGKVQSLKEAAIRTCPNAFRFAGVSLYLSRANSSPATSYSVPRMSLSRINRLY